MLYANFSKHKYQNTFDARAMIYHQTLTFILRINLGLGLSVAGSGPCCMTFVIDDKGPASHILQASNWIYHSGLH